MDRESMEDPKRGQVRGVAEYRADCLLGARRKWEAWFGGFVRRCV